MTVFEKFLKSVLRTEVSIVTVRDQRFLHGVLGVASEVAELYKAHEKVDMLEELGDLLWYCTLLADSQHISLDKIMSETSWVKPYFWESEGVTPQEVIREIATVASILVDMAKVSLFYNKEVDGGTILICIKQLVMYILKVAAAYDITIDLIVEANIAKLEKRYPVAEGYSDKAANRRDLGEEHQAITEVVYKPI
jgi:hypothetical protein